MAVPWQKVKLQVSPFVDKKECALNVCNLLIDPASLNTFHFYLDIAEGTMFIGLMRYNQKYGSPFKLCFGPKSFLTISDPVQMKHVLRDANTNYDKGILAEILKPIMGKGLIPADPVTWYVCFST